MNVDQAKNTRSRLIALARKRQRAGSGSSVAFLTARTANVKWIDLTPVLTEVPWAGVGAVATPHYVPERMTKAIAVAIAAADAKVAKKQLLRANFVYKGELSIGGTQWLAPGGQEIDIIDIIEGSESWWPEALKEARQNLDLQGLPILPLPYLALMKFKASRLQDLADLSRMLGQANPAELEKVRALFGKYSTPDEKEDLESLITLGQLEMQSPENTGGK